MIGQASHGGRRDSRGAAEVPFLDHPCHVLVLHGDLGVVLAFRRKRYLNIIPNI
jgi:hypothetical protein